MGGEHSRNSMPMIEGDAIEVSEFYVLNQGSLHNGEKCCVFSGVPSTQLQTSAKNLKIHRHPAILRYLSSAQIKGRLHIVTEPVLPLSRRIEELSTLQICVGLHNVISALNFLHTKAETSHNNVCCASIYVTPEGVWKLGGLEFMLKLNSVNSAVLANLRSHRYERGIPPEERNGRISAKAIDVYALGVLIEELFKKREDDDLPNLSEMIQFCKERMTTADPNVRASLAEISTHSFFSHDFIRIHRFLVELPLKSAEEKLEFFRELEHQLSQIPESLVASQLLSLLLARFVVLDSAAQSHLLPCLLIPRSESKPDGALFSEAVFRKYVIPKLLQMFSVRDTSVRLLLLSYLPEFVHAFTHEQLRYELLPELLLGVKDLDDEIVAATLRALATLVTILGGTAVVGGKRARLFTDGRPGTIKPKLAPALPERPSPDGGEDSTTDDTVPWSDWEQQSEKEPAQETPERELSPPPKSTSPQQWQSTIKPVVTLADLDALDIKSSTVAKGVASEDDFFRDMEPVISKTEILSVAEKQDIDKFQVCDISATGEGWDSYEDWEESNGNDIKELF